MAAQSAMTPHDALHALRDLPRYEERLTARANGLTGMVWALATAGIFLTYGTADPFLEDAGHTWAFAFLWMPWVLAGVATTGAIWHSLAISLKRDPGAAKGLATSGIGIGLFLVLAAGLFYGLDALADVEWTTSAIMTMANGLFAATFAFILQRRYPACRPGPLVVAGVVMLLAGAGIGLAGVESAAAALLGAFAAGTSWFGAGLHAYVKG